MDGAAREWGSHTAMWISTWGLKRVITSSMRSCCPGPIRWKTARRSRRLGGSASIPSSDPTHSCCSSRLATSDPSSPPIPLTSTRIPMTGHVTPRPWRVARFARAAAVVAAALSGAAAVGAEMSQVGGAATVAATAERRVVEGQGVMFPMATSPKCLIFNNFGGFSAVFGAGGHQGVDIGATLGQAVYAFEDGVLYRKFTDLASAAGNGWGLIGASDTQYRYYHLSRFAEGLAQGDRVQRGQLIGYV